MPSNLNQLQKDFIEALNDSLTRTSDKTKIEALQTAIYAVQEVATLIPPALKGVDLTVTLPGLTTLFNRILNTLQSDEFLSTGKTSQDNQKKLFQGRLTKSSPSKTPFSHAGNQLTKMRAVITKLCDSPDTADLVDTLERILTPKERLWNEYVEAYTAANNYFSVQTKTSEQALTSGQAGTVFAAGAGSSSADSAAAVGSSSADDAAAATKGPT
jgi:hypothetical protein